MIIFNNNDFIIPTYKKRRPNHISITSYILLYLQARDTYNYKY